MMGEGLPPRAIVVRFIVIAVFVILGLRLGYVQLVDDRHVDVDKRDLVARHMEELTDKSAANIARTVHNCLFHDVYNSLCFEFYHPYYITSFRGMQPFCDNFSPFIY
jgi:hypothetical protein